MWRLIARLFRYALLFPNRLLGKLVPYRVPTEGASTFASCG